MSITWNKDEDQFLVDFYAKMGPTYCASKLNKTYDSVKGRAKRLCLQIPKNLFSIEEDKFIIENASRGSKYIAEKLNRPIQSVQYRAQKLNVKLSNRKSWSDEEVSFLIENYKILGPSGCAKILNRTVKSVERKADTLNLLFYKKWTKELDSIIKKRYPVENSSKLAKELSISLASLVSRAFVLGVQKDTSIDKNNTLAYLYIINFPNINLYKVGITTCPERRFKEFNEFFTILSILEGTYIDVENLEKYLLKYIEPYLINTKLLPSGNTETYRI